MTYLSPKSPTSKYYHPGHQDLTWICQRHKHSVSSSPKSRLARMTQHSLELSSLQSKSMGCLWHRDPKWSTTLIWPMKKLLLPSYMKNVNKNSFFLLLYVLKEVSPDAHIYVTFVHDTTAGSWASLSWRLSTKTCPSDPLSWLITFVHLHHWGKDTHLILFDAKPIHTDDQHHYTHNSPISGIPASTWGSFWKQSPSAGPLQFVGSRPYLYHKKTL